MNTSQYLFHIDVGIRLSRERAPALYNPRDTVFLPKYSEKGLSLIQVTR